MILLYHCIAGITFCTESDVRLPRLEDDRYNFKLFQVSNVVPNVYNSFHKIDSSLDRLPQPVESEHVKVAMTQQRTSVYDFSQNRFDFHYSEKFGRYDVERQAYLPEHYVAANFPEIFSIFLPRFSAMLIHSSGVIRNEKVALFLGPDEGGKTTVIEQASGVPVLNDDQIVLREENGIVNAHGTPFGPSTSGPCHAPLRGIFVIEKAPFFELTPLSPAHVTRLIWEENQLYVFALPKDLRLKAFDVVYNACHQARVYRMRFPKDFVDWDLIDAAMQ